MRYAFESAFNQLEKRFGAHYKINISLRFLIDAQPPKKLSDLLNGRGFHSIHTLDLPDKNSTSDKFIKEIAYRDNLVLITKDDDFLRSFIIEKKPSKLALIRTGNIDNKSLIEIFDKGIAVIASLIGAYPLLEITRQEIIVHD